MSFFDSDFPVEPDDSGSADESADTPSGASTDARNSDDVADGANDAEDIDRHVAPDSPSKANSVRSSDPRSSGKSHRSRGSRGRSSTKKGGTTTTSTTKWRSGQVPQAPTFDGDIDADPFCFRKYKKRLMRWCRITREFLPSNEQALRAREQLRGEAETEFEEVSDDRFDTANGIQTLLADLEEAFGERELFRQGGIIREFEAVGRMQGESITAFTRRFRLLERKLQENRVPAYPEEARVVKLLDGLRLDEKATASLLLAAGNKYAMKPVLEAIRIQYPPGMSITGVPHRSSHARKAAGSSSRMRQRRAWHTQAYDYENDYEATDQELQEEEWPAEGHEVEYEAEYDDVVYEEDLENSQEVETGETLDHSAAASAPPAADLNNVVQALTVTSQRLAELTKARGFYKPDKGKGKSKSKGKSSGGKSKGKGKGKSPGKKGGKGKPSPTPTRANLEAQQERIDRALCLGCGSSQHWIRDCPEATTYAAQLTSANVTLDAEGMIVSSWMTSVEFSEEEKSVQLPHLSEFDSEQHQCSQDLWDYFREYNEAIHMNPKALIQYANTDAALMIADTGCQRQVAGLQWHRQRQQDVLPLQVLTTSEKCTFSFGPNAGNPSLQRHAYPAGLAGTAVMLGISEVDVNAPALFSRPAFETLGAVPDIVSGTIFYRALGKQSTLYLSRCGHLAIRVDEWPVEEFPWPFSQTTIGALPDVWVPQPVSFPRVKLQHSHDPVAPPPHAGLSSYQTSSGMVAQLARSPSEPDGVHLHGAAGSDLLCGNGHATSTQGQSVAPVLSSPDGHHHADEHYGVASSSSSAAIGVPVRPGSVSASQRHPELRSSRATTGNLRSMWSSVARGQGDQSHEKHRPQGVTNIKDSHGHQSQKGLGQVGRVIGWLTAAISALALSSQSSPVESSAQAAVSATQHYETPSSSDVLGTSDGREHVLPQLRDGSVGTLAPRRGGDQAAQPHGEPFRDISPSPVRGDLRRLRLGRSTGAFNRGIGGADASRSVGATRISEKQTTSMSMSPMPHLRGSADHPLVREDRTSFVLRKGTQKRLLGDIKALRQWLTSEQRVYQQRIHQARSMRRYGCDLVEIYGGMANITAEALAQGLRVLQPVDQVHGIDIKNKADHEVLRNLLLKRRPFLVLWELRCDPWSNIQHLNYTKEQLQVLQSAHAQDLEETAKTVELLHADGTHFLIENPWGTQFWKQKPIERLQQLPQAQMCKCAMCDFDLRGGQGFLIKKETGWPTDLPELADKLNRPCEGGHRHEECLGTNAKRGQVYTRSLAKAVVGGLCAALHFRGDERFCRGDFEQAWTTGHLVSVQDQQVSNTAWLSTTMAQAWYADVVRDTESWRPILQEAELRLRDKVQTSATVKSDTAFFEQIQTLVPWRTHLIQISRTPKVRRLPVHMMMEKPLTHRAAILRLSTGHIQIETEVVSEISANPCARFDAPMSYAVFIFGEADVTSLNPEDNKIPEDVRTRPRTTQAPSTPAPATPAPRTPATGTPGATMEVGTSGGQAGSQEISFPELAERVTPSWMKNVLRRLHVNLGHPSQAALVRHLAQAGASGPAIMGAKHLHCAVCQRTKMPPAARPAKSLQAKRFNDRVMLDIIYVRDITSHQHIFLSQVDDGTTYHVLDYLESRSEQDVTQALVQGWFRFFGFPDEMLLDAEGAMRGWHFEQLGAQAGIRVRFVPPGAHYQLGKAERHGQAVKWVMRRLVNQHAAATVDEMKLIASMATFAKNTLSRRSGSSPCQWVYGRDPKIPSSLLSEPDCIEAKQVISDSEKLRQTENVRQTALHEYISFEHNEALRKAILRKSRPWRGPIEIGQRIAYYRHKSQVDGEGSAEGYRQGLVIGADPGPTGSIWVRNNRGRIVQVAREQIRGIEGEELWSPSSDDLKMLKSAELDLSDKHPPLAQDQRHAPPQALEDRLVLDADGQPLAPGERLQQLAIMPPVPEDERPDSAPPLPEMRQPSSTTSTKQRKRNQSLADVPSSSSAAPSTLKKARSKVTFEPLETSDGWFLDPDGRPVLVVENARQFRRPDPDYDPDVYKYRTTWSYDNGAWSKLEDQAKMSNLPDLTADLPKPVERLVTVFSPDGQFGRRPSIESAKGTKRSAEASGLSSEPDNKPSKSTATGEDVATPSPTPPQEGETTGVPPDTNVQIPDPDRTGDVSASVLNVYCRQCGCSQWREQVHGQECLRCCSIEFVNDPRCVQSWFDEVEERETLNKANLVYNSTVKDWLDFPLSNVQSIQLPCQEDLDGIHEAESYVLEVGQAYRELPHPHGRDPHEVWSVAAKESETESWQWVQLFDSIHVAADTLGELQKQPAKILALQHQVQTRCQPSEHHRPRVREQAWLARHGRHCIHLTGWDGSPPELQPYFQYDHFAQCYHSLVHDVAMDHEHHEDPVVLQDAQVHRDEGLPSWSVKSWNENTEVTVFNVSTQAEGQMMIGPEADSSEDEDQEEGHGRALRQALKRETPWRTISENDLPGFIKAMIEEWSEWEKWSSCRPVWPKQFEIAPHLILKSRVCYRWKPKDGGKWFKPKARIVVQGYMDPHLPLLSRDAPVLAKTTLVLIVQWAACFNVSLWNGDCKSAFLQGQPDTERPTRIYMKPPTDGIALKAIEAWNDPDLLYELSAPVYGQANAPRRWYLHVLHVLMTELGWSQHSLDPCCFLQHKDNAVVAVLGVHVDDIIISCLPGYEDLLEGVKKSFAWGSEEGEFPDRKMAATPWTRSTMCLTLSRQRSTWTLKKSFQIIRSWSQSFVQGLVVFSGWQVLHEVIWHQMFLCFRSHPKTWQLVTLRRLTKC